MATFVPISYTYVPTAPRSKSAAACRKPASKQSSILNKLQRSKPSGTSLSTPRLLAPAAADSNGGYRSGIRVETSTFYGGSDDEDLLTIEDILYTALQKKGFTTADPEPDNTVLGVEEVASEERGGFIDHSRSASGDNSGGSPDDPIDLLGNDDSSASEAEVDNGGLRAESAGSDAGLFESPETAIDSTTQAPPTSPDEWHDIERHDFLETAPRLRLAEQGASTSNSIRPCGPTSRLSSEPLHDRIRTEGLYTRRARSEATASHSARPRSPPRRRPRALPENQLRQKDCLYISRSIADEDELEVGSVLDIDPVDRQQQEVEQGEDEAKDEDDGPQQEVTDVAAVVTAGRVGDTHPSDEEDGSPRPAERQRLLSSRDPLPEPSHDEAGSRSDSDSDDELNDNKADSDNDDREPRPMKRKRPSSSYDGPMHKKRKYHLQQRFSRQRRPRPKSYRHSPKSHSPLGQGSRVAAGSNPEGRLPLPAPSAPQAMDTEMPSDYYDLGGSSRNILPTLIEVTFRPHSPQCCSFTAVIRDGCDGRGVSFSQLARLVESISHVGKIDDFMIKPIEQHSFLLTGFSRHTASRLSSSGMTVSTAAEASPIHRDATRTRPQHGKAVDAEALASQRNKPSSSDDDGGLSDSDPDPSSDDDGCSSQDEQGRSRTSKHSRWSELDEQRLLAYKKEGKSWEWIFGKFPRRTRPAIRTRWNMVRPRGE